MTSFHMSPARFVLPRTRSLAVLAKSLGSAILCVLCGWIGFSPRVGCAAAASAARDAAAPGLPNILWLTSEDHGPHMGCYGDRYATTPHVDQLAAKGMIYLHAWSCAPVCAPARTTIISGLYPPCLGAEHMRSLVPFPQDKPMFPQLLRKAGYYCTNNAKEDYNLEKPGQVWDDSSRKAHWRNRRPGQPFFAVFNSEKSHESKLRVRPHRQIHDPSGVRVPAYHPDTPEVRQDWAQYYDTITEADGDAGKLLGELEADGLTQDTIVFYYADHGSGMPRSKRWPYNSGLQVPLLVHIPETFRSLASPEYAPGAKSERLVSFVDLAPTVLSLADIRPPDWMQGHAFLGRFQEPAPPYIYGFRGRMDERYDLVRSVSDGRYVYIRNYMPHKIYGQHIDYMFQTPTTQVWKRLHDEGKLTAVQDLFWHAKPPEELYDLAHDPDEVHNLAGAAEYEDVRKKLRRAQQDLAVRIRDVGFLPEGELHSRSNGASPYDMGRDASRYPLERVLETAELAALLDPAALAALRRALIDPDSAVRYWAALGILMRGETGLHAARDEIHRALEDPSPYVRIVAAQTLAGHGSPTDTRQALDVLGRLAAPDQNDLFVVLAALNAVDDLGTKAAVLHDALKAAAARTPQAALGSGRYSSYVPRLLESILGTPAGRQ
jgi:arylsulfatase A-like enzyme